MEIKIQCHCGQKYKFEVEPGQQRLPAPVSCPVCGLDGTAKAEEQLAGTLPSSRVAPAAGGGIRLASSASTDSTGPSHAAGPPRSGTMYRKHEKEPVAREIKLGWKTWTWIILAVVLTLYSFGSKWSRRVRRAKAAISAVAGGNNAEGERPSYHWSLPSDDGAMVLARHTNGAVVAQACVEYYRSRLGRALLMAEGGANLDETGVLLVSPAFQGSVEINGAIIWDDAYAKTLTGLAQFVSERLNTMTVLALMGDDAETGVFSIYDSGQRRFWCERQYFIAGGDLKEVVRTEGDVWVTGRGFKPEGGTFTRFTMVDANDLTRQLGFKFDGRPEEIRYLVLRDAAPRLGR